MAGRLHPLKVIGWRSFYLSTILDDFSRYIIAWELCTSMKVDNVTATLDLALAASGCDRVKVEHRPRLLSDYDSCNVTSDLGDWQETYKIDQDRGAAGNPQTQGKIERWHQTLKNRIPLKNYFFKDDLEALFATVVEHCNHRRYHKSLDNLPAFPTVVLNRSQLSPQFKIKGSFTVLYEPLRR